MSASAGASAPEPILPRVARGEEAAFAECLRRYQNLVWSIAARYLRDPSDIEDVSQDVFVALWRNAAAFDPARASEATFVALVARRRLVDRLRARTSRALPRLEEEPVVAAASLEAHVDARVALEALEGCREEQRKVVLMAALQGMTHDEIARELAMPLGTVKSHYTRTIERVRKALARVTRTNEEES